MPASSNGKNWSSIQAAAIDVLRLTKPREKVDLSEQIGRFWNNEKDQNQLIASSEPDTPLRPNHPNKPELLAPGRMPKRRKAGSESSRIALLHAVAHIELNAINLAWDMVARFSYSLPPEDRVEFTGDWISVACDEARHFMLLSNRLEELSSYYGALSAHDGMWDSAIKTKDNVMARLAIVPMVLEARGLDVTPHMIELFQKNNDTKSANVLKTIYEEEVRHVEVGCKWFVRLALRENKKPESLFQRLVQRHFKGQLKPPFNEHARNIAGLSKDFYLPLSG